MNLISATVVFNFDLIRIVAVVRLFGIGESAEWVRRMQQNAAWYWRLSES